MKRLREISRFECDIRVLRNGFCKLLPLSAQDTVVNACKGRYVQSRELVPGDIYEVTDPALTQFPCDSLLLAGDCIVNESMLTGELFSYISNINVCHSSQVKWLNGSYDICL